MFPEGLPNQGKPFLCRRQNMQRKPKHYRSSPGQWLPAVCLVLLLLSGCAMDGGMVMPEPAEPVSLVLASHDSFAVSPAVLAEFEQVHNARVEYLALGDAGTALNKVILSKDAPLADVMFGVDNAFLSRVLAADIFLAYSSPLLSRIPVELQLDPTHRLLPVDYGFVNLNADRQWFSERGLPVPDQLEDLVHPDYKGLLVVQNPATSSPGLAFLLATVSYFGDPEYLAFWQALRANDVLVTSGWSEAYFEHFTVGSGGSGNRPLVVSYSTSPPADVLFAGDGRTEPASVNVNLPFGTFRQIEFVGILKGTRQEALAQAFIDFMLDVSFQEDIPLNMFVYPVNTDAQLPDLFAAFAEVPADPAPMAPEDIERNREVWIEAWTSTMLR